MPYYYIISIALLFYYCSITYFSLIFYCFLPFLLTFYNYLGI